VPVTNSAPMWIQGYLKNRVTSAAEKLHKHGHVLPEASSLALVTSTTRVTAASHLGHFPDMTSSETADRAKSLVSDYHFFLAAPPIISKHPAADLASPAPSRLSKCPENAARHKVGPAWEGPYELRAGVALECPAISQAWRTASIRSLADAGLTTICALGQAA